MKFVNLVRNPAENDENVARTADKTVPAKLDLTEVRAGGWKTSVMKYMAWTLH